MLSRKIRICQIYFEGLKDKPITEEDIKEYFSQYGNITDCVLMKDKATGVSETLLFFGNFMPDLSFSRVHATL